MATSFSERQSLALQFANDVARMRRCLQGVGKQVKDDDLVYAWADYCDGWCASWLTLPESDEHLLAILLEHLPPRGCWKVSIIDAGDGTGDSILTLPTELLAQMKWKKGDKLSITQNDSGDLILRRVD